LYVLYNIVYTAVSHPFGAVADKIGRDKVIIMGFGVFVFTTLGFALFSYSLLNVIILFAILGVYIGIFDGRKRRIFQKFLHQCLRLQPLAL
jgi:MFS family permease